MKNSHRFIIPFVAAVTVLTGSVLGSGAMAQQRPTLQGLQDQINDLKQRVDSLEGTIVSAQVSAQVTEGLVLASEAKTVVAEFFATKGHPPENGTAAGYGPVSGNYVVQVVIVDGRIEITYGNLADAAIAGKVLSLTPYEQSGGGSPPIWRCGNAPAPPGLKPLGTSDGRNPAVYQIETTTVDNRYLPADCR